VSRRFVYTTPYLTRYARAGAQALPG
jgi:hypothetical protein